MVDRKMEEALAGGDPMVAAFETEYGAAGVRQRGEPMFVVSPEMERLIDADEQEPGFASKLGMSLELAMYREGAPGGRGREAAIAAGEFDPVAWRKEHRYR